MRSDQPQFLSQRQACIQFGMNPRTIRRLVRAGAWKPSPARSMPAPT